MNILCLALVAALGVGEPVDDAVTRDRLENMLAHQDTAQIVQVFKRHRGRVLPFVDSYLEGALKQIESGTDSEDVREVFRRGVEFADLASDALGDRAIHEYAASFASWSPTEQRNFRAGQQAYRAGRTIEKDGGAAADAYASYERSYKLAKSLGDYWGEAMALSGMARMGSALGQTNEIVRNGRSAAALYRRLGLDSAEVEVLLIVGAQLSTLDSRRGGLPDYSRAWYLVQDRPVGDELRERVYTIYLAAMKERGRPEDIAELQRQAGAAENEPDEGEEAGGSE